MEYKIKKGYVAMNKGEFNDLGNITFLNNLEETKKWKDQDILEVEIRFKLKDVMEKIQIKTCEVCEYPFVEFIEGQTRCSRQECVFHQGKLEKVGE